VFQREVRHEHASLRTLLERVDKRRFVVTNLLCSLFPVSSTFMFCFPVPLGSINSSGNVSPGRGQQAIFLHRRCRPNLRVYQTVFTHF